MLRRISNRCTNFLIDKGVVEERWRAIYQYGFELLWSTLFCVTCIVLVGILFRQVLLTWIFLLFFMPIRIAAGGYHAKSYKACFWISNMVALGCVWTARFLAAKSTVLIYTVLALSTIMSFTYIWIKAPVNVGKYQVSQERKVYNRKCAHKLLIAEMAIIVLLHLVGTEEMIFSSFVTSCVVAIMMKIGKEEQHG